MSKLDFDIEEIFGKLYIIYTNIEDENLKELVSDVTGEIDDALYTLRFNMEKQDEEIEVLREKIFCLERYRFWPVSFLFYIKH